MTRLLTVTVAIVLFCRFLVGQAAAAPVYWVPDADSAWADASNWSSDPNLPQASDDVTIDVGGSTFRTIAAAGDRWVLSLRCEENLNFGAVSRWPHSTLYIGAGGGYVNGSLTITEYQLRMDDGGVFTATGTTNLESGDLQAYRGSVLSLPNLAAWTIGYDEGSLIRADGKDDSGVGTLVDLPNLARATSAYPAHLRCWH